MYDLICKAIKEKRRVKMFYKGGERIIEPHAFGYDKKGQRKLRAYQIGGYSESGNTVGWKLFTVDNIDNFRILDDYFKEPRIGYNPFGDKMIPNIICKI